MDWEYNLFKQIKWGTRIEHRAGKEQVACKIAQQVKDGQVIGVGSGSTVYVALFALATRVKQEGLRIKVIPASQESTMTCIQLGLPLTSLWQERPDCTIDGADEVSPEYDLIKGRGGAMFKEKLLIRSSEMTYIIIDRSKLVSSLGSRFPVPVEVFPPALSYVGTQLKRLGATEIQLRMAKGKDGAVITENGNFILDARFESIGKELEQQIKAITGVWESGLFMGYPLKILVADT